MRREKITFRVKIDNLTNEIWCTTNIVDMKYIKAAVI
jgi:hypothetical protein